MDREGVCMREIEKERKKEIMSPYSHKIKVQSLDVTFTHHPYKTYTTMFNCILQLHAKI